MRTFAPLALTVALGAIGVLAWRLRAALRRQRECAEALRAALEARLWEERVLEIDALQATVQDLRRRTHEANNAFSTALLSAQYLLDSESNLGEVMRSMVGQGADMDGMDMGGTEGMEMGDKGADMRGMPGMDAPGQGR